MEFMEPGLKLKGWARGLQLQVETCAFDSWITTALDGTLSADVWVIWLSSLGLTAGGTERRPVQVEAIAAAAKQLVERNATVIMLLPEALELERDPFSDWGPWRAQLLDTLTAALPPQVVQLRVEAIQRDLGQMWHCSRYWTMAKCPAHPDAVTSLGAIVADVIAATIRPTIKAVITDLDNTIWGGVVGEDGVDGLDLDPHGAGRPFLILQRFLKDLSAKGIPICAASKNNIDDVMEVFQRRKEMILSVDDFVHIHANWDDKHRNIKQILESLQLTADDVCFLDDSPVERDQARTYLPTLIVPELPEDPEEYLPHLLNERIFIFPNRSREDLERVSFYKADIQRRALDDGIADADTYLQSLDITLTAQPINSGTLGRCVDLIHKTNQFNLTTFRWTRTEVMDFIAEQGNYATCFEYNDRFGGAGIVGILFGRPIGGGALEVPIFLMSCRVINRKVEDAMLAHFTSWAIAQKHTRLVGLYRPTDKNRPCAEFYFRHGFHSQGRDGNKVQTWERDVHINPAHPVRIILQSIE